MVLCLNASRDSMRAAPKSNHLGCSFGAEKFGLLENRQVASSCLSGGYPYLRRMCLHHHPELSLERVEPKMIHLRRCAL